MPDATLAAIQRWLSDHESDLVADLQNMLRIPSLEAEAEPNAPYGAANREALDLALKLSQEAGMKVTDLDGYIGFAEFGSGEKMILSLGHLDVVPTGPGWKHPEFGAEIDEGYIYARGSVDDKGPTMASFYAMRAIMACAPHLKARFRQAFGCNEETGFGCVHRYMETEEVPAFGLAPDSGWPVCHAEKGIANLVATVPLPADEFQLIEFSGGQRPNIVIDAVQAKVKVGASAVEGVKAKASDSWDANITYTWDDDVLAIRATGKAAHGSTPFMGDSAATRMFRFLLAISPLESTELYETLLNITHPSGVGLGIHGRDAETGDLTSNVGIVKLENGHLEILANIRYPATWVGSELIDRAQKHAADSLIKFSVQLDGDSPSVFFPVDSPLVKTIVRIYREETGDQKPPFTMGGGTYARAVPNTVSIGTGWLGDGPAHEIDERLKIEHLFKMSRIYAHIFYELGKLASG